MSESGKHGSSHDSESGNSPRQPKGTFEALRLAGAGMELGGSAIVCAMFGYAIDRYLQNETMIATALGAIFGFAGGLYRFLKLAMAASRESIHSDN